MGVVGAYELMGRRQHFGKQFPSSSNWVVEPVSRPKAVDRSIHPLQGWIGNQAPFCNK